MMAVGEKYGTCDNDRLVFDVTFEARRRNRIVRIISPSRCGRGEWRLHIVSQGSVLYDG
jgi:hypothetical protein